MRKNKRFVRDIIIVSVIGLITLMIVLFIVLQTYLAKQDNQTTYTKIQEEIDEEPKIELSETLVVRVEQISSNHIIGYDIYNKEQLSKTITDKVKISDAYGNVCPINQIKEGDIVDIDYQKEKDKIVSISKSARAQTWNKISGVTIDRDMRQVNISGTGYSYFEDTLVRDSKGIPKNIESISPFDVVSVQVLDDTVWSVIIEEVSASLNLIDLPTSDGQIEIDNSRLLMFKDVKEPIMMIPGKHKIVIKMRGYMAITIPEFEVGSGEVYNMSLKDAEVAYTIVKLNIIPQVSDYTAKIDDTIYKPGDEIKLQQGEYTIEVSAEGYESQKQKVDLMQDVNIETGETKVKFILKALPEEETSEENSVFETDNSTSGDQNSNSGFISIETSGASGNSRTITVNSEPEGANVYLNNELKGVTPYMLTLDNGTYELLLEKVGYNIYKTNIILDGSNDQSIFSYKLEPKS